MYDPEFTDNPARWKHAVDGHADYVVRMVTDRHSLSLFEIDGARLTMTQIDEAGQEFDSITVTKSPRSAMECRLPPADAWMLRVTLLRVEESRRFRRALGVYQWHGRRRARPGPDRRG